MAKIQSNALETVAFARKLFGDGFIPLHRPVFEGHEREYLIECIDSNFVSSVPSLSTPRTCTTFHALCESFALLISRA